MEKVKGFLKKKDIVFSVKRYGIDALGAMAQGLFCTLLIGTILNTLGNQFGVPSLYYLILYVYIWLYNAVDFLSTAFR